jgi:hypothetical protein
MLRKYEWNVQGFWDTMKRTNLWIINVRGKEIEGKGTDNLFNRTVAENSPNLEKERVTQVQKAYLENKAPEQKRNTIRHIII